MSAPIPPDVRRLTAADESYTHQLVAPRLVTSHVDPTWAERCFHTLFAEQFSFNAGRAIYPYRGERTAWCMVTLRDTADAIRIRDGFTLGDDPDDGRVGELLIEVIEPLRTIRLVLDPEDRPLAFDLTFSARFPPVPTDRNVIELDGAVVTDYMNLFQSGSYDGWVRVGGVEHHVSRRHGFRDRGWGIRKHEGAPKRGFVLFATLEFPANSLYLLLYETASGRRVFTNGWLVDERGSFAAVRSLEHELRVDGLGLVTDGALEIAFDDGTTRRLVFHVQRRAYLSAGGYSSVSVPLGHTRHDLADEAVLRALDGQNDNGCVCRLDDVDGYGVIETGIGAHTRYRPSSGAPS